VPGAGCRVLAYDKERLIDIMEDQLRETADDPDEILREDGAMWICDGLDTALQGMGAWAPMVI
jgi:hypothetical protein